MRPAIGPGYGQEIQEYERREWEAPRSIFRNHLLPGILPLTAVNLSFTVVGAVLTESLLSFFNRTQVDLSWGAMIWIGQEIFRAYTMDGQWHANPTPAPAIILCCAAPSIGWAGL